MKFFYVFLLSTLLMTSCRPFKEASTGTFVDVSKFKESSLKKFHSKNEIPYRIRKGIIFWNQNITFDSTDFIQSKNKALVLDGAFNNKENQGYFILMYKTKCDTLFDISCISFIVDKKVLKDTRFNNIPNNVCTFKEAKQYMTINNMSLFGSYTYKNQKELRQLNRLIIRRDKEEI